MGGFCALQNIVRKNEILFLRYYAQFFLETVAFYVTQFRNDLKLQKQFRFHFRRYFF